SWTVLPGDERHLTGRSSVVTAEASPRSGGGTHLRKRNRIGAGGRVSGRVSGPQRRPPGRPNRGRVGPAGSRLQAASGPGRLRLERNRGMDRVPATGRQRASAAAAWGGTELE